MCENFLQKKGLSNAKLQTRDTHTADSSTKNTLECLPIAPNVWVIRKKISVVRVSWDAILLDI